MAEEPVEIGLRDFMRGTGQPVHRLGQDGKQLVRFFGMQPVTGFVQGTARIYLVEKERVRALQSPSVGRGTQCGGVLCGRREQGERLLAKQIVGDKIRHDQNQSFLACYS